MSASSRYSTHSSLDSVSFDNPPIIEAMQNCHSHDTASSPSKDHERLESQRALELRKFFAPKNAALGANEGYNDSLNDDGALSAFAESALWRLKGVHAMVSLVDRGEQFFLGGAQRIGEDDVSLGDEWFGCASVATPGGLCENTLALDNTDDPYPCFCINDLSQDPRFAALPVVDGTLASYRFYSGTPITTDHGINIGSFFVFDNQPRDGLSANHRKYLSMASKNIMKHLEMKREAAERRRVALMSKGIATFIERTSRDTLALDVNVQAEDGIEAPEPGIIVDSDQVYEHKETLESLENQSSVPGNDGKSKNSILDQIRTTLDHAAEILRESLELNVGGVVFLDTAIGYTDTDDTDAYNDNSTIIGALVDQITEYPEKTLKVRQNSNASMSRSSLLDGRTRSHRHLSSGQVRSSYDKYRAVKVQAMSAAKIATWDPETKVLDGKTLQALLNSYPKGNVWYIDENGYFSSLEQIHEQEERARRSQSGRRRSIPSTDIKKQQAEAAMLSSIFTKARQIIFLPLWDAGGDRWYSACFVWSQSAVPVFTVDSEISYLSAFTSSVMVEISRLDAIAANKMKSDFISSISHEFRSPLHGILASADFLQESELDGSQTEFISTIRKCGGTLLDTINHVLDYSKINSFEMKDNQQGAISNELYQVTNLALLCEDVVNGMLAAKEYRGSDEGMQLHSYSQAVYMPPSPNKSFVAIVIDIERRVWDYKLQAGALRRIVMNIFGNAQKYTKNGYILLELKVNPADSSHPNPCSKTANCSGGVLSLHIKDSGKGMSREYMERKLYQPFAQEDTFSPGVGLGLSIVWSIVNKLGGKINMRSELGVGTDVEINLPLEAAEETETDQSTISDRLLLSGDYHISELRKRAAGKTVYLVRGKTEQESRHKNMVWKCIENYCSEWFEFDPSSYSTNEDLEKADLIITDQASYLEWDAKRVLVVHEEMVYTKPQDDRSRSHHIGHISSPIGPFKFARCILALFDQNWGRNDSPKTRKDAGTQTPLASPDEFISPRNDYDFLPLGAIPFSAKTDFMPSIAKVEEEGSKLKSEEKGDEHRIGRSSKAENQMNAETVASFQRLSLEDIAPGFMPKLPQTPRKAIKPKAGTGVDSGTNTPNKIPSSSPAKTSQVSLNILAVDDNDLNLQLLTRYLQKRKCDNISTATNGVEAVAAVRAASDTPFDVIFMDISMPEMDGFEATQVIRSLERSLQHGDKSPGTSGTATPLPCGSDVAIEEAVQETAGHSAYVVALTGLASRRDRDKAEEIGFDDFLTKPVSFVKIGELLKRLSMEKGTLDLVAPEP
ncbi:sensor histidine kinase response [Phlyctema vagabunda]|uniref:Sensor histidine kinase response n=1 Tax=Phlyctema vagabunda TaxID=108571 RepID=A0ABR4P7A0_9HELO